MQPAFLLERWAIHLLPSAPGFYLRASRPDPAPLAAEPHLSTDLLLRLQDSLRGSYVIVRELGGCGMSRVFLADDLALQRAVVIKVLHPVLAAVKEADAALVRLAADGRMRTILFTGRR